MAGVAEIAERRIGCGLAHEELSTGCGREIRVEVRARKGVIATTRKCLLGLRHPCAMEVQRDECDGQCANCQRSQPPAARRTRQPRQAEASQNRGRQIKGNERALGRTGVDAFEAGQQRKERVQRRGFGAREHQHHQSKHGEEQ
ncbi:MAG: hypothetical protein JO020_22065 [Chloroflexi bacterium]|nr:hypothetical protein [Chloroflexota bacterium]MBV9896857.1 hypothetical protein [Chloroflexota bacterium]